jgi:hypothetical protein
MQPNTPIAFIPAQNANAEERQAHALEFIAARMLVLQGQTENLSRDMLKIATTLQTKLK